jgi:hypothetical protein
MQPQASASPASLAAQTDQAPPAAPPAEEALPAPEIELQDLDDLEFLLNEIEERIAPLA